MLVLLSNHFSTQQLNNPLTSTHISLNNAYAQQSYFPDWEWCYHYYQAISQEVWRKLPICITGSRVLDLSLILWRLIQHGFRSTTWSSQTLPWLKSLRAWEWMIISGCRPSSTMKSWSTLRVKSQPIYINNSYGESLEWESLSGPLYPKLSTCFEGARLTQLVQLVTAGRLFASHKGRVDP